MTPDFEQAVKQALNRTGFGTPVANACSVLLFDSASWLAHAEVAEHWLSAKEIARAKRYRFAHDRHTYVIAHAYWRIALGVFLGTETAAVPLFMAPTGQPTLPDTGSSTSLSHSGSWVAIAIGKISTIGVDIERTPARGPLNQLVSEICTTGEFADLQKLPSTQREAALLALWTRKEALLKAFGSGLRTMPSAVSANPGEIITPPASVPIHTPCQVRNISLPGNLAGALATPANANSWQIHLHDSQAIDGVSSSP